MSTPTMPHNPRTLPISFSRWLTRRSPRSAEQGLTLLEALIAVAVMGLTIGLVLPPLFIAAATRVQTRRAEQAMQIAQGEVDRYRVMVTRGDHIPTSLPAVADVQTLQSVQAPTAISNGVLKSTANCNSYTGQQLQANQLLRVDINGDCTPDYLVQTFRTRGSTTQAEDAGAQRPSDFELGIRVYSTAARVGNLRTEPASLTFVNGEGDQLQRPLSVIYTRLTWGDRDSSLCSYHSTAAQNNIDSCQNTF